jgi:hypothetical protein
MTDEGPIYARDDAGASRTPARKRPGAPRLTRPFTLRAPAGPRKDRKEAESGQLGQVCVPSWMTTSPAGYPESVAIGTNPREIVDGIPLTVPGPMRK